MSSKPFMTPDVFSALLTLNTLVFKGVISSEELNDAKKVVESNMYMTHDEVLPLILACIKDERAL